MNHLATLVPHSGRDFDMQGRVKSLTECFRGVRWVGFDLATGWPLTFAQASVFMLYSELSTVSVSRRYYVGIASVRIGGWAYPLLTFCRWTREIPCRLCRGRQGRTGLRVRIRRWMAAPPMRGRVISFGRNGAGFPRGPVMGAAGCQAAARRCNAGRRVRREP